MNDKKKIQNVMDKIPVNRKLEERLLAMKEGKANEIAAKCKKTRKQTYGKRIVQVAAAFVFFFVLSNTTAFAFTGSTIVEMMFGGRGGEYVAELVDVGEQQVQIGDYRVTMKESIFEKETKIGYAVFEIENDRGEILYDKDMSLFLDFGEEINPEEESGRRRFIFSTKGGGGVSGRAQKKGKTLLACMSFELSEGGTGLEITDEVTNDSYSFKIHSESQAKKYFVGDNTNLWISSLGIMMVSEYKEGEEDIPVRTVEAADKDGRKFMLFDEGRDETAWTTYSENVDGGTVSQWNQFSFAEPIDLERVATVYVNGKEVKDFR